MTPEDREQPLIRFWKNNGPKTPGRIVDWIRRFKYLPKSRRAIVWSQAIRDLPEDVRQYLREWRGKDGR
jgi:hypothetical protein